VDPRERAGATLPCIQLDSVAEPCVDVFRFCENAPDNLDRRVDEDVTFDAIWTHDIPQ
jgi:hypothetical protein